MAMRTRMSYFIKCGKDEWIYTYDRKTGEFTITTKMCEAMLFPETDYAKIVQNFDVLRNYTVHSVTTKVQTSFAAFRSKSRRSKASKKKGG